MLTLIEGGFTSSLHSEIIKRIERSLDNHERVYLIVPEQQTVSAECEMSEILPPSAPLNFEVTNFTRFVNTAFRSMGGICAEYCSPVAKSLIMWRALTELSPMLSMMHGRTNIPPGIVKKALSAVSEMQSLGISAENIRDAAEDKTNDRHLEEKLSDLGLIYALYQKLLNQKYTDSANDATVLAKMLSQNPTFVSGCEIFVDGFTSFTEPQYRLLGQIMKYAPTTVALALDRVREASFEYAEVREARSRLARLADIAGCDKRLEKCTSRDMSHHTVIGEISDLLWRSEGVIDNDSLHSLDEAGGRVRIFSASTVYEECTFVAEDIKRRVMSGEAYSDFAIIVRNTEPYIGILDTALLDADIPHFISKTKDLSSSPAVKLIHTAYAVITRWRREDVLTYLKCGLCGISREERDEFELYIEKWAIDGRRFTDGITWNMNPRGYTDIRDGDAEKLVRIDNTRQKLLEPLIAFEEQVRDAQTVKEHAEALLAFLTSLELEEALAARTQRLSLSSDDEGAEESRRMWGIICDALDAVVDILGDVRADAESFCNQLSVALSGAVVGRIPAHSDEVTVGAADMLRIREKKHVYLLGVNSGEFPATVSDTSFFTERDKCRLKELGLPIEPNLECRSAREFYCFSRAFSQGSETVTILYAEKTAMLGTLHPSDVIERIVEITSGKVAPVRVSDIPTEDMLWSPTAALEMLGTLTEEEYRDVARALTLSGYGDKLRISEADIRNANMTLSEDSLALLYRGDLYLSQTRIDAFLGCPMNYFFNYNMGLDTNERAELGSGVIGSFVHAVIENFFTEAERIGKSIGSLDKEERQKLTEKCAEMYMRELLGGTEASARTRIAISRLVRATGPVIDGLCEEFKRCKYEPTFFELETDMYDDNLPNHLILQDKDGGRVIIRGKIDRVDTFRHGGDVYVRVVDYKTGRNDFLPSKLKEGEYLQMFLYLKAITDSKSEGFLKKLGVKRGGRVIPAGVIYVKTKVADTTVRTSEEILEEAATRELQARDGMILNDPVSIDAMNANFLPTPHEGVRKAELRQYDEDGWHEIERTVEDVVLDVAGKMKRGNIRATPGTREGRNCKWCKFKEICRSAVMKEGKW